MDQPPTGSNSKTLMLVISPPVLTITTASPLSGGTEGVVYGPQSLTATGGTPPYSWTVTSLPPGLTASGATIGGTPTTQGSYTISARVTDSVGATTTQPLSLTITPPTLAITTSSSLPNGTLGAPYGPATLTAAGGTPPYTWTISSLPQGLTASGATISGTPATQGAYTITAKVTDSASASASKNLALTVNPAALTITTTALPTATVGVAYGLQPLTATGGTPPYTWVISSLPAGLTASGPVISGIPTTAGSYTVAAELTDSTSAKTSRSLVLTVNAAVTTVPSLTVAPSGLVFSHMSGGPAPARQSLSVFSTPVSATFSATVSSGAANWLSATPLSGTTSQVVQVAVNPTALQPRTYTGDITITAVNTTPLTRTVIVTLTVQTSPPPKLEAAPLDISVTSVQRGQSLTQDVLISNSGSGFLRFTMQKVSGGGWANVAGGSMTAPATVPLSIDPSNLLPGVYGAQIQVNAPDINQSKTVNVLLTINRLNHTIQLSQTAVNFTAVENGPAPPAQTLTAANVGTGTLDWNAQAQTLPPGLNWLRVTPGRGSHTAGSAPSQLQFEADPKGLAPGTYYATAQVLSSTAANSPQSVSVVLNVTQPAFIPVPVLSMAGVLQVGQAGGANPAAQTVQLTNLANQPVNFTSTRSTADGAPWLSLAPDRGTIPAAGSIPVTIQSNLTSLVPGAREGTIRLGFDGGDVATISVLSSVAPPATTEAPKTVRAGLNGCRPTQLLVRIVDPQDGFTITAQQGSPLRAVVKDDCEDPLTLGTVIASFDSGGELKLVQEGLGFWAGTWTPPSARQQERIVIRAFQTVSAGQRLGIYSPIISGRIEAPGANARAAAQEVRNNATNQTVPVVALGSWVSIHGDRLSDAVKIADTVPYPFALSGTEVRLGDLQLPLFYVSKDQVNALIPAGLNPNTQHQLIVRRENTQSVPYPITVAEVQPGIYSMNSQGFGQGAVQIGNTAILAAMPGSVNGWISRPAKRGEFVSIFATGLGLVDKPPPDGAPAAGELVLVSRPT